MSAVLVHIAGEAVQLTHGSTRTLVRQRCGWCGALLIDYDLDAATDSSPPVWVTGELVLVDGNLSAVVPHVDGDELPPSACAALDPAITT